MTQTHVTNVPPEAAAPRVAEAPETETIYIPAVDIREGEDCIRLYADMPGTGPDALTVTVDKGVLTLEGQARVVRPDNAQLVGQEFGVGRFRRTFTLSEHIDTEGIRAKMQQGVLELTVPKRIPAKARTIKIEA